MLFEHLPLSGLVSFIAVFLIITFFVTSADSGALVVDSLASGGQGNTQVWQRVFWALMLGLVASVLLIAGGLGALQTASIVSALPFAVIMLIAMIGMWRALLLETQRELSLVNAMQSGKPVQPRSWKKRLATLIRYPTRLEVETFVQQVVHPSMTQVEKELNQQGWPAEVYFDNRDFKSRIEVFKANEVEFIYEVRIRDYVLPGFAYPEIVQDEDKDQTHYYRADVFLRRGDQSYDVYGYEEEELISDILDHFERYLQYLHHTPDLMPWKTEQQLDQTLGSNKD
jgi:choline/glycine/proline betaine transport protein